MDLLTYLSDPYIYIPFWVAVARWGLFFFFKVIPAMLYKQVKVRSVRKLKNDDPCKVTKRDVTVIVTAYQPEEDFELTLDSIIKQRPAELIIAADKTCFNDPNFEQDCLDLSTKRTKVTVLKVMQAGKRAALADGIKATKTKLVVLADDDIRWSEDFLAKLIAPFQRYPNMGGVGCKQVGRKSHFFDVLRVMADMRLAVRFLELMATTRLDKGAACISGRTGAYRTFIIQNEKFYDYFINEKFCGLQVQSGDDKCLTRYIMNNGYDTYHQLRDSCKLSTSFKNGPDFVRQLLRWSRNTWRSDLKILFSESVGNPNSIWRKHPFTAFILLDKMITPLYLFFGLFWVIIYALVTKDYYMFISWAIYLVATRILKLCYYLWENGIIYIVYIPIFILFQYFQNLIKIIALITIKDRSWGTRDIKVVGNEIVRTDEYNARKSNPEIKGPDIANETVINVDDIVIELPSTKGPGDLDPPDVTETLENKQYSKRISMKTASKPRDPNKPHKHHGHRHEHDRNKARKEIVIDGNNVNVKITS